MERGDLNPSNELSANRWVDDELAALGPDEEWQPDLQRGLVLLREQRGNRNGRRRRWTWVVAGAMATCLSLMATPVTRAFAQRCLSACVGGNGLGTAIPYGRYLRSNSQQRLYQARKSDDGS